MRNVSRGTNMWMSGYSHWKKHLMYRITVASLLSVFNDTAATGSLPFLGSRSRSGDVALWKIDVGPYVSGLTVLVPILWNAFGLGYLPAGSASASASSPAASMAVSPPKATLFSPVRPSMYASSCATRSRRSTSSCVDGRSDRPSLEGTHSFPARMQHVHGTRRSESHFTFLVLQYRHALVTPVLSPPGT